MSIAALPIRIHPTGRDTLRWEGIESVSYRLTGFLRLTEQSVVVEWAGIRTSQEVSLDRIGTTVDHLPHECFALAFGRIAGIWVLGGWWRPRLELRAREASDLDGMPATRGVALPLRIHRRDRALARAIAEEIEARVAIAVRTS